MAPSMRAAQIAAVLSVALLVACTQKAGDVVVAGVDGAEPELVAYLEELRREVRAEPKSAKHRGRLAMAYDVNDFFPAAAATYAQAAALDPTEFAWPYLEATALAKSGNHDAALAAMDRAIAIDAGYVGAWLNRGAWLLDGDRHTEAGIAYEQARLLAEDRVTNAAAAVGLARVKLRLERPDDAVALLEELAADFPHPHVKHVLSIAYLRGGRAAEARALQAELADTAESKLEWPEKIGKDKVEHLRGFSGRMRIAETMLSDGKPTQALPILEELRAQAPKEARLLTALSFAYRLLGRTDDAEAVLVEGVRNHPRFPLFHFNLGVLRHDRGDLQGALEHLGRAAALDPSLLATHERRFSVLLEMQRFESAIDVFDDYLRDRTNRAKTHFNAGLAAGALLRWDRAIGHFDDALALEAGYPRAELFRGRCLAELGRFDEAETALIAAQSAGTDSTDIAAARQRLELLRAGK
jgi:tetratricopeptide (TPR) repeat protein